MELTGHVLVSPPICVSGTGGVQDRARALVSRALSAERLERKWAEGTRSVGGADLRPSPEPREPSDFCLSLKTLMQYIQHIYTIHIYKLIPAMRDHL